MDVFRDQRGNFRGGVADDIKQGDDVWTPGEVLENLDFTLDFLLLDGLQDLDDALLLVDNIDALEYLAYGS